MIFSGFSLPRWWLVLPNPLMLRSRLVKISQTVHKTNLIFTESFESNLIFFVIYISAFVPYWWCSKTLLYAWAWWYRHSGYVLQDKCIILGHNILLDILWMWDISVCLCLGIFVALALRFDVSRRSKPQYFTSAFVGYVAGVVLTIVVMNWFQAAQVSFCLCLYCWRHFIIFVEFIWWVLVCVYVCLCFSLLCYTLFQPSLGS